MVRTRSSRLILAAVAIASLLVVGGIGIQAWSAFEAGRLIQQLSSGIDAERMLAARELARRGAVEALPRIVEVCAETESWTESDHEEPPGWQRESHACWPVYQLLQKPLPPEILTALVGLMSSEADPPRSQDTLYLAAEACNFLGVEARAEVRKLHGRLRIDEFWGDHEIRFLAECIFVGIDLGREESLGRLVTTILENGDDSDRILLIDLLDQMKNTLEAEDARSEVCGRLFALATRGSLRGHILLLLATLEQGPCYYNVVDQLDAEAIRKALRVDPDPVKKAAMQILDAHRRKWSQTDENFVDDLLPLLETESPELRTLASRILGWFGSRNSDPSTVDGVSKKLAALLNDPELGVRIEAGRSLARFDPPPLEALPILAEGILVGDARQRIDCLDAIFAYRKLRPPAPPEIIEALKSQDSSRASDAAESLVYLTVDVDRVLPDLLRLVATGIGGLETIARLDLPFSRIRPSLEAARDAGSIEPLLIALPSLRPREEVARFVETLLVDGYEQLDGAAELFEAYCKVETDISKLLSRLRPALVGKSRAYSKWAFDSSSIRDVALENLCRLGARTRDVIPDLEGIASQRLMDKTWERVMAIDGLGGMGREAAGSKNLLMDLLKVRPFSIRWAAALTLLEITGPIPELIPILREAVVRDDPDAWMAVAPLVKLNAVDSDSERTIRRLATSRRWRVARAASDALAELREKRP